MPRRNDALARERLLFRYSRALERGDFETVSAILADAEHDPALERLILDVNTVYADELQRLAPGLSTNHRRTRKASDTMSVTAYPKRRPSYSVNRPVPFLTLAAAALAIFIIGSLLLAGGHAPQTGSSAVSPATISQRQASPTPVPSAILTATSPSLPISASALPATALIAPTVGAPQVLCSGVVQSADGVNVFSRPNVDSLVVGRLDSGAAVEVLDLELGQDVWYFVSPGNVQGWIRGEAVRTTSPCLSPAADGMPMPTLVPPASHIPPATATPDFQPAIGMGFQLVTRQPVGSIPGGTRVRISHAEQRGPEWVYMIVPEDRPHVVEEARAWQLMYAPGITPGPTPTSAFMGAWDNLWLVTTEDIGDIRAGTRVRIGSGWFQGRDWQYDIVSDDGRTATAWQSQLTYAPEAQITHESVPTVIPGAAGTATPFPTEGVIFTLTPSSTPIP